MVLIAEKCFQRVNASSANGKGTGNDVNAWVLSVTVSTVMFSFVQGDDKFLSSVSSQLHVSSFGHDLHKSRPNRLSGNYIRQSRAFNAADLLCSREAPILGQTS